MGDSEGLTSYFEKQVYFICATHPLFKNKIPTKVATHFTIFIIKYRYFWLQLSRDASAGPWHCPTPSWIKAQCRSFFFPRLSAGCLTRLWLKEMLGDETHDMHHIRGKALKSLQGFPTVYCAVHTHWKYKKKTLLHTLFRGQRSGTTILRRPQCLELIFSTGEEQYETYEVLQSTLCINDILCAVHSVHVRNNTCK